MFWFETWIYAFRSSLHLCEVLDFDFKLEKPLKEATCTSCLVKYRRHTPSRVVSDEVRTSSSFSHTIYRYRMSHYSCIYPRHVAALMNLKSLECLLHHKLVETVVMWVTDWNLLNELTNWLIEWNLLTEWVYLTCGFTCGFTCFGHWVCIVSCKIEVCGKL